MSDKKFASRPKAVPTIIFLLVILGAIVGYFLIFPAVDQREVSGAETLTFEAGDIEVANRVSSTGKEGSSDDPLAGSSPDSSNAPDGDSSSGSTQSEDSASGPDAATTEGGRAVSVLESLAPDGGATPGHSEATAVGEGNNEPYTGLIQSEARPLGLEIIGLVEADPEDEAYMDFKENGLQLVMEYLDGVYDERAVIDSNTENLDLSDMILEQDSDVRVYFLKEGTVFRNTLGIDIDGDQHIIFPNASSAHSYYTDADTRNEQTSEDIPLLPGDYVDIGQMPAGSLIDLFLIQDGARNENGVVFWGDAESNEDELPHAKFMGTYGHNTYIIGFEDIPGGGDRDYNDVVIAVEIEKAR